MAIQQHHARQFLAQFFVPWQASWQDHYRINVVPPALHWYPQKTIFEQLQFELKAKNTIFAFVSHRPANEYCFQFTSCANYPLRTWQITIHQLCFPKLSRHDLEKTNITEFTACCILPKKEQATILATMPQRESIKPKTKSTQQGQPIHWYKCHQPKIKHISPWRRCNSSIGCFCNAVVWRFLLFNPSSMRSAGLFIIGILLSVIIFLGLLNEISMKTRTIKYRYVWSRLNCSKWQKQTMIVL